MLKYLIFVTTHMSQKSNITKKGCKKCSDSCMESSKMIHWLSIGLAGAFPSFELRMFPKA
jgi:hypothetical protein